MKKLCFIIALTAIAVTLHAQQWEIDYGDANSYTILAPGITNSKGDVILVGVTGTDRYHYNPMVMKVGVDGEHCSWVFDSISGNVELSSIVELESGNYFASACVNPDIYGEGEALVFLVFDSDFNVVNMKRYEKQGNALSIGGGHLLLDNDGTVIAAGSYRYQDQYGPRNKPYFYRLDENADSLSCRYVTAEMPHPEAHIRLFSCFQLLKNPTSEGFVVLCEGLDNVCSLLLYDRDFNYEKGFQLSPVLNATQQEVFNKAYSDHWLTDNKLLLMGDMWPTDEYPKLHIGMAEFNLDGTFDRWEKVYYKQDTAIEAALPCMAYVNDSTIYGASSLYRSIGGINTTSVCVYNTDMELLGKKEFAEDDYFNLSARFILPLRDGGCLVAAGVGTNYLGIYAYGKLIKLSREDLNPIPTSVKEIPVAEIKGLAYPNPATTELNIDISALPENKEHRVQISNAMGRVCMDRIIRGEGNVLTVGVSDFSPGAYIYLIYNNENEIIHGKFIKQ